MEPWQEEILYRQQLEKRPGHVCAGCGERITSEQYLELEAFGLEGKACQRCVEGNMQWRFS